MNRILRVLTFSQVVTWLVFGIWQASFAQLSLPSTTISPGMTTQEYTLQPGASLNFQTAFAGPWNVFVLVRASSASPISEIASITNFSPNPSVAITDGEWHILGTPVPNSTYQGTVQNTGAGPIQVQLAAAVIVTPGGIPFSTNAKGVLGQGIIGAPSGSSLCWVALNYNQAALLQIATAAIMGNRTVSINTCVINSTNPAAANPWSLGNLTVLTANTPIFANWFNSSFATTTPSTWKLCQISSPVNIDYQASCN